MKVRFIIFAAAFAVLATGCAKEVTTTKNDAAKRHLEIWMHNHYPSVQKTEPGIYILNDVPGTGKSVETYEEYPYIRFEYQSTDLEGNYKDYSSPDIAKQLGTYDVTKFYGPSILSRNENGITAGVEAVFSGMKVGGTRTAVIPGWLNTYKRYKDEEGYLKNVNGDNGIYTVKVIEVIKDIKKWETDSLEKYVHTIKPGLDSLKGGLYYIQTQAPSDTNSFKSGTKILINYTGRLLNGRVFDSSNADTAKIWNIYSSGRTYGATTVIVKDEWKKYYMGTSSSGDEGNMIDGFAYALSKMRTGEKGIAIFHSDLGYGTKGSGDKIPGFSPLIFELEVIGKSND